MLRNLIFFLTIVMLAAPTVVVGQGGVSSASYSLARAAANTDINGMYLMPSPELFRVEELINYHRHDLPLPKAGQRVHLDLQQMRTEQGKTVFQIGVTTPRAMDPSKRVPLNVVLVIDRSGSMGGDRISKVRDALRLFAEQFRECDRLSIVGFGNDAKVDLAAGQKNSVEKIAKVVDSLEADYGGTNLYAGLMLGYKTALQHYDPQRTNRVIFLTDGNANVGVTESEEIAEQSTRCNAKGISLMTIGLGVDFNYGLLRQISDAGLGPMHYVADAEDIQKIFVEEVDSLLAPAASQVILALDFGKPSGEVEFFGYQPKRQGRQFVVQLDDLNHGATQVVIARLTGPVRLAEVGVTLNYVDALTHQEVGLKECSSTQSESNGVATSISRNYAIALVAKSLRRASQLSQEKKYQASADRLAKGIQQARQLLADDQHVNRMVKIADQYRQSIQNSIDANRINANPIDAMQAACDDD